MDTRLKAALAAAAGTTLMLGGAGSLAYWNDVETGTGTVVNDGELTLSALDCGTGWLLDGEVTAYDPLTQEISPGDSLQKVCTTTITALGEHLDADLTVETPSWDAGGSAALEGALASAAVFQVAGGVAGQTAADVTEADHGKVVTLTLTVTFPYGGAPDNTTNDTLLTAALDDVDLTLVQSGAH